MRRPLPTRLAPCRCPALALRLAGRLGPCLAVAGMAAALPPGASARLVEELVRVPVTVQAEGGRELVHPLVVTVYSDDANPRPAPVLVIGHGRAPGAAERAAMGRLRFAEAARFFVRRGFIVAVPTRMGYGVTGGADLENTGPCEAKNFPPGYAVAAEQVLGVLAAMRRRADADPQRAVVVGQSYGGAAAAAVAARNPPGVLAAINFAGGGGGNAATMPGQPCASQRMEGLFRSYGQSARVPMLWVYARNDLYFGEQHPREWHAAFVGAGGRAEFVQLPPVGEDGHALFARHPAVWQPIVAEFLDAHGFRAPRHRP